MQPFGDFFQIDIGCDRKRIVSQEAYQFAHKRCAFKDGFLFILWSCACIKCDEASNRFGGRHSSHPFIGEDIGRNREDLATV